MQGRMHRPPRPERAPLHPKKLARARRSHARAYARPQESNIRITASPQLAARRRTAPHLNAKTARIEVYLQRTGTGAATPLRREIPRTGGRLWDDGDPARTLALVSDVL